MKGLSNFRIVGKLYILIFVAFLGMAAIGGLAQHQMGLVYSKANHATEYTVPSFNSLFKAQDSLRRIQIALRDHIAATDARDKSLFERTILDGRESIGKELKYYGDGLVFDREDGRLLEQLRTKLTTFYVTVDERVALSREGKIAEAIEANVQARPIVAAVEQAFLDHLAYNEKMGVEGSTGALQAKSAASWYIYVGTALLVGVIGIVGWVIATLELSRPIGRVSENLKELADGRLDVEIHGTRRRDEVGDIARAAQIFKEFVQKLETQGWVKTQEAKISAELQQAATIPDLAQKSISMLCPLIGAQHGLFYILGDEKLEMRGRYGFRERKALNNEFAIGEGLVGQCAMERQPITITKPPHDYIQISSGLGEATPAVIAVLPIIQAGTLRGVIELAALQPFSPREMALLDELTPVIGTHLELLERSVKAQTLLKETQEQAERMEAQAAQLEEQSVEMEAQQAELAGTEAWYRSIIAKAPDGALVVDSQGTIILSNAKAEELFGYDDGKMDGMSVDKLVPSSIRGDHHKNRDGFMSAGGSRRMGEGLELTGVRADGSEFAIEIGLSRLPDVGGRGMCAYASIRDVTEKQKAQAELKFANMMSDTALELSTAGYWRIDYADPDYYIGSERTAAIFGELPKPDWRFHLADEWLSRITAVDAEAAKETTRLYEAALNGAAPFFDVTYPYKRPLDGKVIWTRAVGKIVRDEGGRPKFMYGVNQDVTEQKQADRVLSESRATMTALINSIPDLIFYKNPEGVYIGCNEAFGKLVGKHVSKIANRTDYDLFPKDVADFFREKDTQMLATLQPTANEEWVRYPDGRSVLLDTLKAPFADPEGKVLGILGISRDVTNRNAAEVALKEAKADAEAATKAKGDFLASMSHEIRTPMNGITGMADLLAQTDLDDDQKHMLKTIRDSGNALITVINDILDFSKIEAGKLDLEDMSMSVADAVEGVASTLTPNATKKGLRIDTFVDPAIPAAVQGDAVRVRQVLFNLTGNAVKFSDNKDVALRASLARTDDDGRVWVRFDIIDHGIGISEEGQAKLFQAFSQAESSTTRKFGGTGLGLAICKRLVEMMGGTVGLKSKIGEGSVFTAELPFTPTDKTRSREKPRDLGGLRVVLVGSAGMREEAILAYLSHWGAEAISLSNDREATDLVQRSEKEGHAISSLILDLGLDAVLQTEAIARIRKALPKRSTPVILMQDYQARGARIKEPDVITVDVNPLVRYRIVTAVAVAAGRASPEIKSEADAPAAKPAKAPTVEEAMAQGQLILLAEDNLTNQDVIRRQLNLLGYTCEIANNGVEGLKAYETGRHVLLLTDCHMPEMDGYELTGSIREREKSSGVRLPIIAVTANALQGEAERCLAAGMDDYVSKPIAMPILSAALKKWMPPPAISASALSADSAAPAASRSTDETHADKSTANAGAAQTEAVIDPSAIRDIFGDDDATFKEILLSFVELSQAIVGEIMAAWEKRSAVGVKNAAHKLKSSARSVGAHALADTCEALEKAGKADDWKTIDALAGVSKDQLAAVETFINAL